MSKPVDGRTRKRKFVLPPVRENKLTLNINIDIGVKEPVHLGTWQFEKNKKKTYLAIVYHD